MPIPTYTATDSILASVNAIGAAVTRLQATAIDVRDHGSVADGVTDNRAAILAAIAAATAGASGNFEYSTTGHRAIIFPQGVFAFSGVIDVPNYVDLRGAGKTLTTLKALGATAQIKFGSITTFAAGSDHRHGRIGGFSVDGNNVALRPLVFGFQAGGIVQDIGVHNSAGDGVVFASAQNMQVFGLVVMDCAGVGIVHDLSCGGISIYAPHVGRCGSAWVSYVQTAVTGLAYAAPQDNSIYDPIFEYLVRAGGLGHTADRMIYHGAGVQNAIIGAIIGGWDATKAVSLVKMEKAGTPSSVGFRITDSVLGGSLTHSTAFDLGNETRLVLSGVNDVSQNATVFKLRGGSSFVESGADRVIYQAGTVATYFDGTAVAFEDFNIRTNVRYATVDVGFKIGGVANITPKVNPGGCVKGDLNVGTDGKLYVCSAANVWTVVGTQV